LASRTSSSKPAARVAILFGALSILAVPAGIAASRVLEDVRLLEGIVIAVPVAFVLSLLAIAAARRARFRLDRSVFRTGARTVRVGRFLAWTGMYVAVTGALALGFYAVLRAVE
jgi:hypothetical protein